MTMRSRVPARLGDVAMMTTPSPYATARADVRDLIATPLSRRMQTRSAIRTPAMWQPLQAVPLDLAAAGYRVTVEQRPGGWYMEIGREIAPGIDLHVWAEARAWTACLYQLHNNTGTALDRLEAAARRERARMEAAS